MQRGRMGTPPPPTLQPPCHWHWSKVVQFPRPDLLREGRPSCQGPAARLFCRRGLESEAGRNGQPTKAPAHPGLQRAPAGEARRPREGGELCSLPQSALFVFRVAPEHRHGCRFLNSRTPRRRHPAWALTAAADDDAAAAPLSLTHAWARPTPPTAWPSPTSCAAPQKPSNHAKKHTLRFANGIAVPVELGKPDEAAALAALQESLKEWRIPSADASAAAVAAPFVPSYVALDKKVRAAVGRRCDLKLASPAGIPEAALSFVWEGVVVSSLHHRQAHPRDSTHHPQVLRYFAFFREPVPDSPLESWRVRKVQLLYYLEDGERGLVCGAQLRS